MSGHPRETISPYESDSERGNKTAASERRKEGERDSNITNTNTERTAPKGILVRESEKEEAKLPVILTSPLWACNFELTLMQPEPQTVVNIPQTLDKHHTSLGSWFVERANMFWHYAATRII